jgi:antitoxin (DNA-binding transcriptional repressor) of toxin-antitoxin stability system
MDKPRKGPHFTALPPRIPKGGERMLTKHNGRIARLLPLAARRLCKPRPSGKF